MTKEQARVFVKAEKNKMTPAQIHENSRQIIDRLISQDFFYSADTVLTYVSYNQEVETHSFIDNCLSLGKTVLVPKVYGRDMKFHRITALSELKPGKYGILEPDNTDICEPEQGLMIMPGLAFDKEHHRARIWRRILRPLFRTAPGVLQSRCSFFFSDCRPYRNRKLRLKTGLYYY